MVAAIRLVDCIVPLWVSHVCDLYHFLGFCVGLSDVSESQQHVGKILVGVLGSARRCGWDLCPSPLPPKPTEKPAVDVALGEGGALLGVQVGAVVLVGCLGAGEGACPGELPDAGWHLPNEAHLDGGQQ